jgi:zinc protease
VLDEAVYSTAFREHPYHHPTIGWRTDVEGVPTARLKAFYDTFYHPNNATAILVGDFERTGALELINKYFGAYPASKEPIPEVYTEEPQQQGERRLIIRRAGELALVQIAFHTPGVLGQMNVLSHDELSKRAANPPANNDIYPLVLLSTAMSNGVTSRLYQALVEKDLAVDVRANADQHRDPGLFNIYATVRPGVEPKKVEEVILSEMSRVAEQGLTAAEVEKARQQIIAQVAFSRDGTAEVASQLSEAEAVADWRFFSTYEIQIRKVTAEDVQRVARAYFNEDNRTVGYFIPKQAGGGAGNGGAPKPSDIKPRHTPRGVQFHHEPNDTGDGGSSSSSNNSAASAPREESSDGEKIGGSVTPQAKEQQAVSPRNDKSSAAVEALTAESVAPSNFAARVKRTELPNGATLLVLENRSTPTFSLRGSFRAGSFFEPRSKPGLAQLTADMLERGTLKRNKLQLAGDLEAVGAQVEFGADPFVVNIAARALSKDLPLVMRTLAEELREPAFPADELEKLKQQTIAAIQEQQASTSFRARERLSQLIFDPANPFYMNPGDQLIQSIKSITVEDVRRFYTERYGGRSLTLSIVGDVRTADVERQFEELFGPYRGPQSVDIQITDPQPQASARRDVVLLKDKANVDILIGSAAPLRRESKDFYAALLANSALGESTLSSRLGLQVRDKEGLTYGIFSRFRAPSLAAGPWYVGVSVNPNNVEKAINSALNVLRDYVKNGIRPDELADEKSAAIGSFKVSLSTNAGLAQALWNAEFYKLGVDHIDRYPQIIQAVTVEEVNAAIRKYFRPDQLTVVIAGDFEQARPSAAPTK